MKILIVLNSNYKIQCQLYRNNSHSQTKINSKNIQFSKDRKPKRFCMNLKNKMMKEKRDKSIILKTTPTLWTQISNLDRKLSTKWTGETSRELTFHKLRMPLSLMWTKSSNRISKILHIVIWERSRDVYGSPMKGWKLCVSYNLGFNISSLYKERFSHIFKKKKPKCWNMRDTFRNFKKNRMSLKGNNWDIKRSWFS